MKYAFFVCLMLVATSCTKLFSEENKYTEKGGGGRDVVRVEMPFPAGVSYRCSQGAGGSYSHRGTSTRYDVDFDTPNDSNERVYAPAGGIAYVHEADISTNFGRHVNIDLGDGTYIILAHLSEVYIENESEVAAGQLIGSEGTTGNSTGDHVHMGRHLGSAARDGIFGTSQEGLEIVARNATLGTSLLPTPVASMTCHLTYGHVYESGLAVTRSHPNGTLVKTPSDPAVYLIEHGERRTFLTEGAFVSRNYNFANIALIDEEELACYSEGEPIAHDSAVRVVYDDVGGTGAWLLQGRETDPEKYRMRIAALGWQGVAKSWGESAATYDDLAQVSDMTSGVFTSYPVQTGNVTYREGSLISPADASDVYVMSDGVAMPIETWSVFLRMGFWGRTVLEVERNELESVARTRGSCATGVQCVNDAQITACGEGDPVGGGAYETAGEEETPSVPEDTDEEVVDSEPGVHEENELTLTWTTPRGERAERITLSGEITREGEGSLGWRSGLLEEVDTATLVYRESLAPGDAFRFSFEYVVRGRTSWSCLGPFPPGTVQGTVSASWDGRVQTVTQVADPTSSGCGLLVEIEE